jgi:hypothetical protein
VIERHVKIGWIWAVYQKTERLKLVLANKWRGVACVCQDECPGVGERGVEVVGVHN